MRFFSLQVFPFLITVSGWYSYFDVLNFNHLFNCRVSRFWWKFLRNVFFQVRLTQLLKRSSTISIFLKSDKFSLRNDLFSPANQAAIKFFFSMTHNFLSDDHFALIVKPIKRSWVELSETLPFFAKRSEKRCFLLIATFAKIDFCPNSEFSLM